MTRTTARQKNLKALARDVKRVAIYTRVSSEDQAKEGTSLGVQEDRLTAHVEATPGWVLAGHYQDAGVSGAKASRPGLDRLMADVRAGLVDVVLVTKWDRLGRSLVNQVNLWQELDEAGVEYHSLDEPQSSGEGGKFVRNVLAVVAEDERDRIRARTMSGRLARVQEGGWSGGAPPFGFAVEGKGKEARLVLNDAEASMVRYAVSLLLDKGMGPLEVVNALNAEGYTPRKAPRWTLTGFRSMLTRGPFGGVWTYAKPSGRTKAEPIQVAIPTLLDPERHQALLKYLKATSTPRREGPVHPLSGLLVGPCGHPYHGIARRDRGNRRYRCRYAKDVGRGWTCDAPSVLADFLDDRVWEAVVKCLADPDELRAAADDHLGLLEGAAGVEADALGRAQAEVARIETALQNALTTGLKAGLSAEVIEGTVKDLKVDLANAQHHVGVVAAMAADTQAQAQVLESVQAVADLATERLVDADPAMRAKVFGLLSIHVRLTEVAPGGSPVAWHLGGQAAHGLLLATLAPGHRGVLSLAKRTSRYGRNTFAWPNSSSSARASAVIGPRTAVS